MSEDCPHCVFEKAEANCRGCFEGSHYKPKPVTNADRIRAMSDEELAEFFVKKMDYICKKKGRYCDGLHCVSCTVDWLRDEAQNG